MEGSLKNARIPTINMELVAEKLLPPKGVYATAVEIGGKYYTGVTNVGCKPTVNHSNKVNVETHILDFPVICTDMN